VPQLLLLVPQLLLLVPQLLLLVPQLLLLVPQLLLLVPQLLLLVPQLKRPPSLLLQELLIQLLLLHCCRWQWLHLLLQRPSFSPPKLAFSSSPVASSSH
jgi:hypothetical protein